MNKKVIVFVLLMSLLLSGCSVSKSIITKSNITDIPRTSEYKKDVSNTNDVFIKLEEFTNNILTGTVKKESNIFNEGEQIYIYYSLGNYPKEYVSVGDELIISFEEYLDYTIIPTDIKLTTVKL